MFTTLQGANCMHGALRCYLCLGLLGHLHALHELQIRKANEHLHRWGNFESRPMSEAAIYYAERSMLSDGPPIDLEHVQRAGLVEYTTLCRRSEMGAGAISSTSPRPRFIVG